MRILQISPQVPVPLDTGGRIGIYGITKYLAERGNEIHFVTYHKDIDHNWAIKELRKFCIPYILNVQTSNRILPAAFNLLSTIPYNISKFISSELKIFLIDFFRKNEVDIVHVDHLHLAWTINILRKLTDVPIVLREHNLEMMIMKRFYERQEKLILKTFAQIQYLKFKKYEPTLSEKFDMCITVSSKDEELLSEMNPKIKIQTITPGVDQKLLNYKRGSLKPFSIAHVGQLNWQPNLDSLQWFINDILPTVVKQHKDIKLYVYGAGDYTKIKIPEELLKNIIFKGYVEDIWKEMEDKTLLVVPLRIGSGIRIKILEMLAFGQSIITTSIGKEGLDLNDQEHLLVADSENEFAAKIIKFFNGEFDNLKMLKNSQNLVRENYTWEKIAEEFEQLYLNLINK